jgi:hypothetical protein
VTGGPKLGLGRITGAELDTVGSAISLAGIRGWRWDAIETPMRLAPLTAKTTAIAVAHEPRRGPSVETFRLSILERLSLDRDPPAQEENRSGRGQEDET